MRIFYEILKIALGVVIGAALVAFLNVNLHLFSVGAAKGAPIDLSYADLAAINLTVATVVLGGVALIVAVAAVFGFQIIRTESVSNAEGRVKEELPIMIGKTLPGVLEAELGRMENDGRLTQAMERAIYSGGSMAGDYEDEGEAYLDPVPPPKKKGVTNERSTNKRVAKNQPKRS